MESQATDALLNMTSWIQCGQPFPLPLLTSRCFSKTGPRAAVTCYPFWGIIIRGSVRNGFGNNTGWGVTCGRKDATAT